MCRWFRYGIARPSGNPQSHGSTVACDKWPAHEGPWRLPLHAHVSVLVTAVPLRDPVAAPSRPWVRRCLGRTPIDVHRPLWPNGGVIKAIHGLPRGVWASSLLGCWLLAAHTARADCSNEGEYIDTVNGNTVKVGPVSASGPRRCGSGYRMLRQSLADGALVEIPAVCDRGLFIDECVAAGQYRYGFADAYTCAMANCGSVSLYTKVAVTQELAADCARTVTSVPTASSTAAPWQLGDTSPAFKECDNGCACHAAGGERASARWVEVLMAGAAIGLLVGRRNRLPRSRNQS